MWRVRRGFPRSLVPAIGLSVGLLLVIFVITNWTNGYGEVEFPTVKCNCPTLAPQPVAKAVPAAETKAASTAAVVTSTATTTMTTTTPPLPPCIPVSNESAVQRAIIIYYPHHQSEYFFPEVRW